MQLVLCLLPGDAVVSGHGPERALDGLSDAAGHGGLWLWCFLHELRRRPLVAGAIGDRAEAVHLVPAGPRSRGRPQEVEWLKKSVIPMAASNIPRSASSRPTPSFGWIIVHLGGRDRRWRRHPCGVFWVLQHHAGSPGGGQASPYPLAPGPSTAPAARAAARAGGSPGRG